MADPDLRRDEGIHLPNGLLEATDFALRIQHELALVGQIPLRREDVEDLELTPKISSQRPSKLKCGAGTIRPLRGNEDSVEGSPRGTPAHEEEGRSGIAQQTIGNASEEEPSDSPQVSGTGDEKIGIEDRPECDELGPGVPEHGMECRPG
jgi:hypothetical protein